MSRLAQAASAPHGAGQISPRPRPLAAIAAGNATVINATTKAMNNRAIQAQTTGVAVISRTAIRVASAALGAVVAIATIVGVVIAMPSP